jgi:hypothetical protein
MKAVQALLVATAMLGPVAAYAQGGPAVRRVANMPDGAPAFELIDARGQRVGRIECVFNGWYDNNTMAANVLGSRELMAALITKGRHLSIDDLGPAKFDCVPVASPKP